MSAVLPGATIGILGGGRLGRMTAIAARSMGYRVHALDPDPDCAARPVVDKLITASFDDAEAAAELAKGVQVVTLEIEKISTHALEKAAQFCPVRPGASVLEVIQDKGRQKSWLAHHGFPVGPFVLADSAEKVSEACARFGDQAFVKRCQGGYDSRGQVAVESHKQAKDAFAALGEAPCIVEQALALQGELSVMVARRPSGQMACFPVAQNHHRERILDTSVLPAPIPEEVSEEAVALSQHLAQSLKVEGLLAVELFLLEGKQLVVNELAPRPHNTFHATEVACTVSQFEQLVRAVCDLPLGTGVAVRPAAIANLLGDIWLRRESVPFEKALGIPDVRLHLYGKAVARAGRKMGHLSAIGSTPEDALAKVTEARRCLDE